MAPHWNKAVCKFSYIHFGALNVLKICDSNMSNIMSD